ncbi:MAG: sodium:proton antiporter [Marinilabiliales bacterium]|nr:MAG: sodium:proton antiporter [Marinilabiliales bacterium]
MQADKNAIIEHLKRVVHPDKKQDIISLGMVDVDFLEGKVVLTLRFDKRSDPFTKAIGKACERVLKEDLGIREEIEIKIIMPEAPPPKDVSLSGVKNILLVASGKGGVGKSTVASNLAVSLAGSGKKVGLLDADIFGPSVPKMFATEKYAPEVVEKDGKHMIVPVEKYGVKLLSIGYFVKAEDATIWRGPMASGALKQLLFDAIWGELDYLIIDLPPGTSDIHLTVAQETKVDGAVIVSTPQAVALADVVKGINMFKNENISIPVLGVIENMSWFTPEELPDNKYYLFGKGGCKNYAEANDIELLGQVPIIQSVREDGDQGSPSVLGNKIISDIFKSMAAKIEHQLHLSKLKSI